MKSLNLGIVAHVDAGKTSLTERLLFNAGVIKNLGSVDTGNTQTDSLALEQKRGITIKSAVVSFDIGGLKINLIDTPGHPDFIAEVERALSVLDAVVLVVSAVEGVQAQTRVLVRTLKKMHIPMVIFVNKIDRMGAGDTQILVDIKQKLALDMAAANTVTAIGMRQAQVRRIAGANVYKSSTVPLFWGSATTGVGVAEMMAELEAIFTPALPASKPGQSAVVFKIERSERGEKIAYVRVYSGTLQVRRSVTVHKSDGRIVAAKITTMHVFKTGKVLQVASAKAGDIVKIWGLFDCHIGDVIGEPAPHSASAIFARPSLEVVVGAKNQKDKQKLHTGLTQLSEQDPLIRVRQNETNGELSLSLYGEVQKEVIEDALLNQYGVDVTFQATTPLYIERPQRTGQALEIKTKVSKSYLEWDGVSNPFLATIGLRVEPGAPGSGVRFTIAKEALGKMPLAFFAAIEETVPLSLQQGLYGWQVTDCVVTLVCVEYYPRQSTAHGGFNKNISSTARDFRYLVPLVLMDALKLASTAVYEPLVSFELEVPATLLNQVLQRLAQAEARLTVTHTAGATAHLAGHLPARNAFSFAKSVPDLTQGEGMFVSEFGGYQKVPGQPPQRLRTDNNPLNRVDYFRRTLKKE